jgi:hypothetical protein
VLLLLAVSADTGLRRHCIMNTLQKSPIPPMAVGGYLQLDSALISTLRISAFLCGSAVIAVCSSFTAEAQRYAEIRRVDPQIGALPGGILVVLPGRGRRLKLTIHSLARAVLSRHIMNSNRTPGP